MTSRARRAHRFDQVETVLRGLFERAAAWRSRLQIRGFERPVLAVAFLVFLVATVVAVRNAPFVGADVRWSFLPLLILLVPAGVVFNAGEYLVSARIAGHRVGIFASVRVAAMAAAANQLPLPGSVLLRTQALKEVGIGYGRALGATGLTGLAYLGAALSLAGLALLLGGRVGVALVVVGAGGAFLALTLLGARAYTGRRAPRVAAALIGVELGSTLAKAAAFLVVARALNFDVTFTQALVVTLAVVITSSLGFFPGGLGLRELLAGAISPLVGLPVSVGLVTTAANRVAGLILLSLMSLLLAMTGRHLRSRPATADPPIDESRLSSSAPSRPWPDQRPDQRPDQH